MEGKVICPKAAECGKSCPRPEHCQPHAPLMQYRRRDCTKARCYFGLKSGVHCVPVEKEGK